MGNLALYKPSRHKHQWFGVCLCPPGKFRSNHSINPVLVSTWNRHKISQYTHAKYSNTSTSYYVHWVCRPAVAQTDFIKANRVNHTTYAELKDEKRWGLFVFWLRVAKDDLSPDNLSFQSLSVNKEAAAKHCLSDLQRNACLKPVCSVKRKHLVIWSYMSTRTNKDLDRLETLDCTCSTLTAVSGVPSSGWSRADMWRAAVTPSEVERTLETKCDFAVTQQCRNMSRIIRVPAQLKLWRLPKHWWW